MSHWLGRLRTRTAAFVHDLAVIPAAWLGAYWLRFNLESIPEEFFTAALFSLAVILPAQAAVSWVFGLYRGVWRFASMPDMLRIIKAVVFGVGLSMVLLFILTRLEGVPRSVPALYSILLIILLSGPRFLYRWLKDYQFLYPSGKRVMLVGAGRAGEMLVRDLLRYEHSTYQPVLFVDDSRHKWGGEVHGIRVLGGCDEIPRLARQYDIEMILLAVASATSAEMQRLVELCEQSGVPFRTLPPMHGGNATLNELREVSIDDLLGRDPVSLDWGEIKTGLVDNTVMVTGGGGSIGAELCRQLARLSPAKLVIF